MERVRRTPKTPKRFEDEAFVPTHQPQKQQQIKPEPTPKTLKVKPAKPAETLKVKLAKPRLSRTETPKPVKETPRASKEVLKTPRETPKTPKESPRPTKEAPKVVKETPKLSKETPKPLKDTPKPSKETLKPSKETPKSAPVEVVKVKLDKTPKPKEIPKIVVETVIQRQRQAKRPRTPPIYADLIPNTVLPFWDARTAAEIHEDDNVKELVHCQCEIIEESGLMVQCETCLTWQHAHCLGIDKPEDAPDGYTCKACSDPKFARESMKWAYDQDWLTKGRLKQFPCDPYPVPEKDVNTLRQVNQLISNVLNVHQIIHSLRIKNRILMSAADDDPELKLFKNQWPATYQHRDGSHFIPTITQAPSTPASTISAIVETPEPEDIAVESVADVSLPDIGQLEDVSAILDSSYVPPSQNTTISTNTNPDPTPNDCRANLRLHIQQTEEFVGIELAQIEEHVATLERESATLTDDSNIVAQLDSLKNDLQTMRKYISINKQYED